MNGGSVIAMTGKDCVAIASDLRLGQQAVGLTADFEKVSLLGCMMAERVCRGLRSCERRRSRSINGISATAVKGSHPLDLRALAD